MMRIICILLIASSLFLPSVLMAQKPPKSDFGLHIGSTLFFGDLGGANFIGRPLFYDLERSLIKPVFMLSYHYQYSQKVGFRIQAAYTVVSGDDKLIQPKQVFAPEWYRSYRNLDFHTKLWEVSAQAEYFLHRFEPGSMKYRWGPYILLGAGVFHFNPKSYINGTEVELRPLHTEGQGFAGIDLKEYALYQPTVIIGAGLRYNVTSDFIIGVEYADRKTFTDYIDDVSTSYASQSDFDNYFSNDPATAALAYQMSVKSEELDPDGLYSFITAPGQQRGDPKDKDHFIYPVFSISYIPHQRRISKKQQFKCMKWGGSGGSNTKLNKQRNKNK